MEIFTVTLFEVTIKMKTFILKGTCLPQKLMSILEKF